MDVKTVSNAKENPNIADFGPGDRVRVSAKVVEGDRERIQVFEGDVIRIRNSGPASTFTCARSPAASAWSAPSMRHSPRLEKVEVVRRGKVRRARLYYLRGLRGRAPHQGAGRSRGKEARAARTARPSEAAASVAVLGFP